MNKFKELTLSAIEHRIHAARIEHSTAVGDMLSQARFVSRRLLGIVAGHAYTLNTQTSANQLLSARQRIAAPH